MDSFLVFQLGREQDQGYSSVSAWTSILCRGESKGCKKREIVIRIATKVLHATGQKVL